MDLRIILLFSSLLPYGLSFAGIVEMPDVVESPSLYGTSVFENYNIPSTNNRSIDTDAGPRLWVNEIRIQGLENFPELGIRREEITAFIEKRRFDIMREDQVKEHGFTDQEVTEVITLLNKLDVQTNYEHVSTPELQKFIWLVRSQKERRGLTLGQIESLGKSVETYYHQKGLQLASAYIPRQSMRDGVLVIEVLNGKMGAVEVSDNQLYNSAIITSVFDDILAIPVEFGHIEERMYLVNDYPGLNVTGIFKPGYQVGDSKLELKAVNESSYEGTLRLDNHGSDLTGEYRGFAELHWNNPTGFADQLDLAVLQSTSPDNSTYGLLGYRLPLFSPRWHLGISASTNQFILDQSQDNTGSVDQLGLTGETRQSNMDIEYTFMRSRETSLWFRLIHDTTKTILNSGEFGNLGLDDKIRNLRLSSQFDVLNSESKLLHLGSFTYTDGEFLHGAGERDETYTKYNFDYTLMTFVPLAWFDTTTRLLVKSEFQYSSNPLPSAEQNALASPTTIRAYPVNQYSADTSAYLGIEWVFNTPDILTFDWFSNREMPQKMQPVFFINAGKGIQNTTTGADDIEGTLVDAGFGIQYGFGKHINGNLQFAFPLNDKFTVDSITVEDDSVKVVFDLQYRL